MSALGCRPAVFLDRDGVILENREDYIRSWDEVRALPGAFEALARASHAPHAFVIVTNQSAVGRGLIDLSTAEAINARLVAEIRAAGGRIDGVFMCPHAPEADCDCRKPKPALILQASEELGLDLPQSVLIGDALTDLEAARLAGVGRAILVATGRGREQLRSLGAQHRQAIRTACDLSAALDDIPGLQA
jgi:D-glycero-D-manno-heptose 1,7-bisphosphate phosphatase